MSKAIYIATIESDSGKSLVSLGLLRMMLTKSSKVGYFRPIINEVKDSKFDDHTNTAINFFNLDIDYDDCYAYKQSEVVELLSEGKSDDVIHNVIKKYKKLEAKYDYVLVEGTDFSGEGGFTELDVNLMIAKNLNAPALIVGAGNGKKKKDFVNTMQLTYQSFINKEVDVIGIVANKIEVDEVEYICKELKHSFPKDLQIDIIPKVDFLTFPTVKEVVQALNGRVLFGEQFLDNAIGSYSTGAMQLRNYLTRIKENALVVTPGDRADIILGALQANASSNYPKIAGIILTGTLTPEESILKLIEGVQSTVPIILADGGTFKITNKIGSVKSKIYATHEKKILLSLDTFDKYVNAEGLTKKLTSHKSDKLTPSMFQYNLLQKARVKKKHIVLPEGDDERIIRAAARLQLLDIVDLTLLGDKNTIQLKCDQIGLQIDLDSINILNPEDSIHNDDFAKTLYEARKHKGMTETTANDLTRDVSYYGTLMIMNGLADGMVSGAVHTTMHTIKPSLQLIKTKPGVSVVSSVFFMCLSDRVSVMGDCAVNPNPNAEQLAEIAISSAQSAEAFGIEAKVAMLSYSSGSSGKGEEVEKVRKATEIVKAKNPNLKIEGPIQYDAAVDMSVAKTKMPNSEVAGQASVLIFPDLNTGNNTYKAIQRETGALAIGPMLQGLNKPVNDLSRGCTVDDIFNTVLLTAIQAEQE
ncbi:phosphate acetyltransferase [Polaribacter reichenbachii]|uniref:Phosphate acetyltransferase n=1 Tax=Polaribacter reichenbachii TaxID=996801 RepID=A0A1B8U5F8_9FLAO|nr:phosphate acetyltransferase [Polaribacter reichenbachii]APZ47543.1 phosphate acetyltransferase [Polaribacter reichenbachii]AUC18183.1 phosphate acetyltransferase [Polaribacter reichenbachii]OBY67104.1 phosphate acetyltransferase [Polaribacter reichenbachii]